VSHPIVIAGGGTGGHVFVAQSVADALLDTGVDPAQLRFVGSRRGQESTLLAGSPIALTLLPGRGLDRSWAPGRLAQNLVAAVGLAVGSVSMLVRFAAWRPRAVVSVGGYAALPAGLAAGIWRRPLILVNIDVEPGSTHRLLARFATASCVVSDETPLPNPTLTGAPVRGALEQIDRSSEGRRRARAALACDPDRAMVAVVTGSLGARSVNEAVLALAFDWAERAVTLYHVTGRRDFEQLSARRPHGDAVLDYRLVPFEEEMGLVYQACDVLVCRAGALTVAEIGVVGLCSILVPLPGAPGDHQTKNALSLANQGAAVVLGDAELSPERLGEMLVGLLEDEARRASFEEAARRCGHPKAAASVAKVVLEHA
jgi:UDP-N-acetylglucosamine--N-acetylmuramyl-(pentapeptide) pyrophosphoryl-undecaprenol N-acetylglucosamine transferase